MKSIETLRGFSALSQKKLQRRVSLWYFRFSVPLGKRPEDKAMALLKEKREDPPVQLSGANKRP